MSDVTSLDMQDSAIRRRVREPLRTVLIFAHECAPFNRPESTIGAQRPAQFAKYLPEFGWRAIVLCCDKDKRGRGWFNSDREAVEESLRRVDQQSSTIVATASLAWDGMLDRAWRRVTQRGATPGNALLRKPLTFAKFFTGDYSQSWQPCAREAAEIIARYTPIHACIGEHSPDAGIFLARWFSKQFDVPWIADFRDPMLRGFRPRLRPVFALAARRMLSSASHVVSVDARCVQIDRDMFRRPTSLISNGYDPEQFLGPSPTLSKDEFRIVYTGSVQLPRGLRVFLDGMALLRTRIGEHRFRRIRFIYRGNAAVLVARMSMTAGVSAMLDCKGFVPHREAVNLMRSAHVLLVLSTSDSERRDPYWAHGVCPGKTYEYLASRRPIICVPGDGAMLDTLLRETRSGVSLGDAHRVAAYLQHVLTTWERTGDLPASENDALIGRFSRRAGAQRLAEILSKATGNSVARVANAAQPGVA